MSRLKSLKINFPDGWFGCPFKIHWTGTLFLIALACVSLIFLAFGVALYISVMIHELAHAIVAKKLGYKIDGIILHVLGGGTLIKKFIVREGPSPGDEFKICFAGPIASIALGLCALAYFIPTQSSTGFYIVHYVAFFGFLNLFLAIYNLFPVWPLDGGRILHAFANYHLKDNLKSINICTIMGLLFGLTMIIVGIWLYGLGWIIIGAFCILWAISAYGATRASFELQLDENSNTRERV